MVEAQLTSRVRNYILRPCWDYALSQIVYGKGFERLDVEPVWKPALTIPVFSIVHTSCRGRQVSDA